MYKIPCQQEHSDGDTEIGSRHVDPDIQRQRHQEGEQVLGRRRLLLVENAHTGVHVGHGEVHGGLPDGGDGHVDDGHVRLLRAELPDHPRPLAVLQTAVRTIRLEVELKLEFQIFRQGLSEVKIFILYLNITCDSKTKIQLLFFTLIRSIQKPSYLSRNDILALASCVTVWSNSRSMTYGSFCNTSHLTLPGIAAAADSGNTRKLGLNL